MAPHLENPMDRGAWKAAVHGVARSQTQLSDFTFTFHFHALEKEMATHSSVKVKRLAQGHSVCGRIGQCLNSGFFLLFQAAFPLLALICSSP